jgi:hypothetical protein
MITNFLGYVAGCLTTGCFSPSGSFDLYRWEQNVRAAEKVWFDLQHHGFAAICVHTMARYAFGRVSEEHGIAADLIILGRCDFVMLCPGWEKSKGTLGEIEHAQARKIPVFKTLDECIEWRAQKAKGVRSESVPYSHSDDMFSSSGILNSGSPTGHNKETK